MNLLDLVLEEKFVCSREGEIVYNAKDAEGYHRGDMGTGKPKVARIYSVYKVDMMNRVAHCESRGAWGNVYHDAFPLYTLEAYSAKEKNY